MRHQAHQAYRRTTITASPLVQVVRYYDLVLAALRRTKKAIEDRRLEEAFNNLHTATTILQGLCQHLDLEKGGPFAGRMRETYIRLIMSALHAFGKPDAQARYGKLIEAVGNLRNAWAETAQVSK